MLEALSNGITGGVNEAQGLQRISDNGSQHASVKFICKARKIKQILTNCNNPKGNTDKERIIRTIKEDLIWPRG